MKIRVEHAACRETFDDAQLFNSKQNQRRPDVIKKLDGDEQDPERDSVSLRLSCESDAVMANEHECLFLISRDPSHRYLCHVERSRDISRYHNSMARTA